MTNFTWPMESSTLLPKIQRKSMFPARCRMLPCMNIALKIVSSVAGWPGAEPVTPRWPSQAISPAAVRSQWSPRWVISYGIAP